MELEHSQFDPFHYHRGAFIGKVTDRILDHAKEIGLPINGRGRAIRMALASELLDREITTYNNLTDQELWDIEAWTYTHPKELREWLKKRYGYQEALL